MWCSSIGKQKIILYNMELIAGLYLAIGLILGIERLSRVAREDDSPMVCTGITAIIVLWPLYIVYKIVMCLSFKR